MIGASTAIGVAGSVYRPAGYHHSHLSDPVTDVPRRLAETERDGTLASAANALSHSLSRSGFIDISASFADSFTRYLKYQPSKEELGDLNPGALQELMALVKSKITADPEQALAAQARMPGPAAVRLLK